MTEPEHQKTKAGKTAFTGRGWLLPAAGLVLVLVMFVLGKLGVLPEIDSLVQRVQAIANSPWGLPALVGLFCVGAFIGAPQFALMAAAMVAFGPMLGMLYAWGATLCSGALTYWTGRLGGHELVRRVSGRRVKAFIDFLGANAFKSSLFVRLVPAGPFILVNMAFGASRAGFASFMAGLAVGALPKLAVVALVAQGVISLGQSSLVAGALALLAAVLVGVWLLFFKQKNHY